MSVSVIFMLSGCGGSDSENGDSGDVECGAGTHLEYGKCVPNTISVLDQVPGDLPMSGLRGYWPLNGTAEDFSGNNYHGYVSGATEAVDRHGNQDGAFYFDGFDDRIRLGDRSMNRLDSMTVGFWFKTSENESGRHFISASNSMITNEFLVRHDNGLLVMRIKDFNHKWEDVKKVNDGNWHHLTLVRFQKKVTLFFDGILESEWIVLLMENCWLKLPVYGWGETRIVSGAAGSRTSSMKVILTMLSFITGPLEIWKSGRYTAWKNNHSKKFLLLPVQIAKISFLRRCVYVNRSSFITYLHL